MAEAVLRPLLAALTHHIEKIILNVDCGWPWAWLWWDWGALPGQMEAACASGLQLWCDCCMVFEASGTVRGGICCAVQHAACSIFPSGTRCATVLRHVRSSPSLPLSGPRSLRVCPATTGGLSWLIHVSRGPQRSSGTWKIFCRALRVSARSAAGRHRIEPGRAPDLARCPQPTGSSARRGTASLRLSDWNQIWLDRSGLCIFGHRHRLAPGLRARSSCFPTPASAPNTQHLDVRLRPLRRTERAGATEFPLQ